MRISLLVMIGSALGGLARFWLGIWSIERLGPDFPWGTLGINVIGSFVIGLAATALPTTASDARAVLMIGFCGGFTTFSSFSLQSYELLLVGRLPAGLAYMAGSVGFCLVGTAAGWALGRGLA